MTAPRPIPSFLKSLYALVSDESNNQYVAWTEDGTAFRVFDISGLAANVLPKYFRHSNASSFYRQLNFYSFKKTHVGGGGGALAAASAASATAPTAVSGTASRASALQDAHAAADEDEDAVDGNSAELHGPTAASGAVASVLQFSHRYFQRCDGDAAAGEALLHRIVRKTNTSGLKAQLVEEKASRHRGKRVAAVLAAVAPETPSAPVGSPPAVPPPSPRTDTVRLAQGLHAAADDMSPCLAVLLAMSVLRGPNRSGGAGSSGSSSSSGSSGGGERLTASVFEMLLSVEQTLALLDESEINVTGFATHATAAPSAMSTVSVAAGSSQQPEDEGGLASSVHSQLQPNTADVASQVQHFLLSHLEVPAAIKLYQQGRISARALLKCLDAHATAAATTASVPGDQTEVAATSTAPVPTAASPVIEAALDIVCAMPDDVKSHLLLALVTLPPANAAPTGTASAAAAETSAGQTAVVSPVRAVLPAQQLHILLRVLKAICAGLASTQRGGAAVPNATGAFGGGSGGTGAAAALAASAAIANTEIAPVAAAEEEDDSEMPPFLTMPALRTRRSAAAQGAAGDTATARAASKSGGSSEQRRHGQSDVHGGNKNRNKTKKKAGGAAVSAGSSSAQGATRKPPSRKRQRFQWDEEVSYWPAYSTGPSLESMSAGGSGSRVSRRRLAAGDGGYPSLDPLDALDGVHSAEGMGSMGNPLHMPRIHMLSHSLYSSGSGSGGVVPASYAADSNEQRYREALLQPPAVLPLTPNLGRIPSPGSIKPYPSPMCFTPQNDGLIPGLMSPFESQQAAAAPASPGESTTTAASGAAAGAAAAAAAGAAGGLLLLDYDISRCEGFCLGTCDNCRRAQPAVSGQVKVAEAAQRNGS